MFVIFPILLILSALSIKIISNKKISYLASFGIMFFLYTLLTSTASSFHVKGVYNISVLLILIILPIPYGLYLIIRKSLLKEYWKEILILTSMIICISFFFMTRPTSINVFYDYRLYLPMTNSVSNGHVNDGLDSSYILYSKLSIYHFFGVINFMSFVSTPIFMNVVVPLITATIISFFIMELKRFKIIAATLVILIFQTNLGYQYIFYGSLFWSPLLLSAGIFFFFKKKHIIASMFLISSMYCASSYSIGVMILSPLFIVASFIKEKKLNIKTTTLYFSAFLLSIVLSINVHTNLSLDYKTTYLSDLALALSGITILMISFIKKDFNILSFNIKIKQISKNKNKIILTTLFSATMLSYVLIYAFTTSSYIDLIIFTRIKNIEVNIGLFVILAIIANLFIIWVSEEMFVPTVLTAITMMIVGAALVADFTPFIQNYVFVRLFKIVVVPASITAPIIICYAIPKNSFCSKKSNVFEWIVIVVLSVIILIIFFVKDFHSFEIIGKWNDWPSKWRIQERKYLSNGVYDEPWLIKIGAWQP